MLAFLLKDLAEDMIDIRDTSFMRSIIMAYTVPDQYSTGRRFSWLRSIGENFTLTAHSIATVVNLQDITEDQHWVSLIIGSGGAVVYYGDSLGQPIPAKLHDGLSWWITHHGGSVPNVVSIPTTTKQEDTYSCGIHAIMALENFLQSPEDSIDKCCWFDPTYERLRMFNCIANMILENDSPDRMTYQNVDSVPSETIENSKMLPAKVPSGAFTFSCPSPCGTFSPSLNYSISSCDESESLPEPSVNVDRKVEDQIQAGDGQSKISNNLPAKGKLTSYWSFVTKEEHQAQVHTSNQRFREKQEKEMMMKGYINHQKDEEKKKQNREAQQRWRERERSKRLAQGWIPRKGPKELVSLKHSDLLPNLLNVAEKSRPKRRFKEDIRKRKPASGKPSANTYSIAVRTNWKSPVLWAQIEEVVARVPKPWSPREITRALRKSSVLFSTLTEQVVGRWVEPGKSRWTEAVLGAVAKGYSPGGQNTRVGILAPYPEVQNKIHHQLTSLRGAGVPLTTVTVRALMIAIITEGAPEIYEHVRSDGSKFKCSEAFVRKFLHNSIGWSERHATRAAQKLSHNYEDLLEQAYFHKAWIIRDFNIPAALRVNTDQTQLVYQQGSSTTWAELGSKQVATLGQDEKRAFTLIPSISASGTLLPMQAVYMGKTTASCPSPTAPRYEDAIQHGFRMMPSKTSNYWSTEETMRDLVNTIIAPYFENAKSALGLPTSQHSIWKIDCWSVHRSESFLHWMRTHHPNIIIIFVPGGCTGLWQPLDVGIQRVLKLSLRRSAHRNIVHEVSQQIQSGVENIHIDTTLPTLRDRSVQWIMNVIQDIDDKELILKAFEQFSPETLEALQKLFVFHPELFTELNSLLSGLIDHFPTETASDDEQAFSSSPEDDSDVPIDVLRSLVGKESKENTIGCFTERQEGGLERMSLAESEKAVREAIITENDTSLGQDGKRPCHRRKPRVMFGGKELWEEH
ncbi:hypothetical protein AGABI1DRAFT_125369 [Agaricus bisporus var. burnettii JB137-S8]|uniref:Ubiquitin-like protease family profile domain-containing protein n=1 Tax=Agaricus bisporus var. burnettii (strain JB137-S8 / ATCC MYA-4627 / FGSC 10392) TaxID=597362 RepID=K5XHG8_AGABU|nr:uncharacterized protein AGABI1DRAFT_125369 [Agaricus bisporus var. burnettii JB137-S8]EKM82903.1 hypothetical protein AGABI1DRAFT_125369 [Agaricus bisporus var. burnettii JB137-S8]